MGDQKKWIKWWCDAPSDPKVQMLPSNLRWAFPALLSLAKKSTREGYLEMAPGMPYPDEALAAWCGMSLEDTKAAVDHMLTVTLLESVTENVTVQLLVGETGSNAQRNGSRNAQTLRFKRWDKRQKTDSYNRVKRFREKHVTVEVTGRETTEVDLDLDLDLKKDQNQHHVTRPKSNGRFTIPTVEEVSEYCRTRGNNVDPVKFHAFYTSNGWRVGKNPMKNWKAAVVSTWERAN